LRGRDRVRFGPQRPLILLTGASGDIYAEGRRVEPEMRAGLLQGIAVTAVESGG
jgi:hypothetical protein